MISDPVAIYNERTKLLASFLNALGLAVIGVGALAPAVAALSQAAPLALRLSVLGWCAALGLAMHVLAHYILGRLKKAVPHDPV